MRDDDEGKEIRDIAEAAFSAPRLREVTAVFMAAIANLSYTSLSANLALSRKFQNLPMPRNY